MSLCVCAKVLAVCVLVIIALRSRWQTFLLAASVVNVSSIHVSDVSTVRRPFQMFSSLSITPAGSWATGPGETDGYTRMLEWCRCMWTQTWWANTYFTGSVACHHCNLFEGQLAESWGSTLSFFLLLPAAPLCPSSSLIESARLQWKYENIILPTIMVALAFDILVPNCSVAGIPASGRNPAGILAVRAAIHIDTINYY